MDHHRALGPALPVLNTRLRGVGKLAGRACGGAGRNEHAQDLRLRLRVNQLSERHRLTVEKGRPWRSPSANRLVDAQHGPLDLACHAQLRADRLVAAVQVIVDERARA